MSSDLPMFITAVEALVVHDGKILTIVRSSTDEHAPGTLTFPAGKVEYGEDVDDILESTVIREVEEETGVIVDQPRYLFSRMFKSDTGLAVVLAEFVCHYAAAKRMSAISPRPTPWPGWLRMRSAATRARQSGRGRCWTD